MGNDQGKVIDTTTPEGVQAMDERLQRKFSKGIQHNMKVVIRGDRNTGKTCLLHRMQGRSFTENYLPTDQIQVAHILWTYPGTNDTAKVEIWDVVDFSRSSKKTKKNLKLTNEPLPDELGQSALDAAFLDVYKGSHGAIFMYDITKQWTWQYIERELQHVPLHIPIVVIGNFSDMHVHRVVSKEDAEFYVKHLNRPEGAADIRYAESSMKNGFGLRYLHKFLSVPFLQLQQESLLHQLKSNREQLMVIHEELDCNEDQDYEKFVSEINRPVPEKKNTETPPTDTPPQQQSSLIPTHTIPEPPPAEPVKTEQTEGSVVKKLSSKFSGFLSKTQTAASSPKSPGGRRPQQSMGNVDDFVPEGDLDDQFFDNEGEDHDGNDQDASDSDHDANPQVTLDEDLSSDEEEEIVQPTSVTKNITPPTPRPLQSARDIVLTDSEEEEAGPVVMGNKDIPDVKPDPPKKTKPQEQLLTSHHTTKPAKKSTDLLLDFNESPSPVSKEKVSRHSSKESRKKKKSKSVEEKNEDNRQPVPQTNEDPFDFTSSLDAWLAGDDSSPSIQPRSTLSISKKVHKSIEEEDDEEEKRPHKSKKKKSRDGEDKKRKKSKSKKSSEVSSGFEDLL